MSMLLGAAIATGIILSIGAVENGSHRAWEYKFVSFGPGMTERLNEVGRDGWEAVGSVPDSVLLKRAFNW